MDVFLKSFKNIRYIDQIILVIEMERYGMRE